LTYWLDANVFIQAKNKEYPFEIFPQFWAFLEVQLAKGNIKVTKFVYDELTVKGNDDLAKWCKLRKTKGLCISPTKDVQDCYRLLISPFVTANFSPIDVNIFHASADGWIIAHALIDSGVVVTNEIKERTKTAIKIPNICEKLNVRCIDTFQMIRDFGTLEDK